MSRGRALGTSVGTVLLSIAAGVFGTGVAAAQAPPAPSVLAFYDGSSTPAEITVAPWAAVFLDGRPATLADLHSGVVADVVVDGQGQAIEVLASDRAVSGVVSSVRVASSGNVYLVIGGHTYELRQPSAVVASGGAVIGSVAGNRDLIANNPVIAHLGPDGEVGFVQVQ